MNLKYLVLISIIEVSTIIILCIHLFNSYTITNNSTWLDKSGLLLYQNKKYKYYYEPKPNTKIEKSLAFMGKDYGYNVIYSYNNDTLRDSNNISVHKNSMTYRIAAIGDSFTFGVNLNQEETYPVQLEGMLNSYLSCKNIKRIQVLNLGVPGYDIQYAIERFRLRGEKYNPDLIIWFIIPDDLRRINELMMKETISNGNILRNSGELQEAMKKGNYYLDYKKARDDVLNNLGEDKILLYQENYLKELNKYYKKKIVIFTFPNMDIKQKKMLQSFVNSERNVYLYDEVTNINIKNGIFPDNHPNSFGAKMIAEDVKKYLLEKNIIDCF